MVRLVVSLLVTLVVAGGASADDWDDCASNDPDRSIRGCTRILDSWQESRADLAIAFFNRGYAYSNKGNWDRAIAEYTAAIQLDPSDHNSYINRGSSYDIKGEYQRAIADYTKALQLLPQSSSLRRDIQQRIAEVEQLRTAGRATVAAPATSRANSSRVIGRRVALVIGNSRYDHVPELPNPRTDATAIANVLRSIGFAEVKTLFDVDQARLRTALRDFSEVALTADWAVIYYAGHGIEVSGTNYIIPVDATLATDRSIAFEAVALNDAILATEGAKQLSIVIVDACRNNPFRTQMAMTIPGRQVGRGLARVEPTGGVLVVYAAREGQIASDGQGSNSPFAAALANRLDDPGVEVSLLFRRVRDDVLAVTGNAQEPFTYGSLSGDEYYFVPPGD